MKEKICAICGEMFIPYTKRHFTCGKKCRNISKQLKRSKKERENGTYLKKCGFCGEEFRSNRERAVYCCLKCRGKGAYKRSLINGREMLRQEMEEKTCSVCGETFKTKFTRKIYCSKQCEYKARRMRRLNLPIDAEEPLTKKVTCEVCGLVFYCSIRATGRKFCGVCREEVKKERMDKWRKTGSWMIFERDGRTCQNCGRENIPLVLDHIVPLSKGGREIAENLQTFCRRCNVEKGDFEYPNFRLEEIQEQVRDRNKKWGIRNDQKIRLRGDTVSRRKHLKNNQQVFA